MGNLADGFFFWSGKLTKFVAALKIFFKGSCRFPSLKLYSLALAAFLGLSVIQEKLYSSGLLKAFAGYPVSKTF